MTALHVLTIRLSPSQYKVLGRLEAKLNIDKTNIIRLALTRLAEAEGLLHPPK